MHDPESIAFSIRRPWPQIKPGRKAYWPPLITVWHNEPGGSDSGTVCKERWRMHVHHWSLQVHPYQHARRRVLTRCGWCGGPSRKDDPVNISHAWHSEEQPWWRGEQGLYHLDCSLAKTLDATCLCEQPDLPRGVHSGYGICRACGKFRPWQRDPAGEESRIKREIDRAYRAATAGGHRDTVAYALYNQAHKFIHARFAQKEDV